MPVRNKRDPRRTSVPLMTMFSVPCVDAHCDFVAVDFDVCSAYASMRAHFESDHLHDSGEVAA
jgi:hypothetical protein